MKRLIRFGALAVFAVTVAFWLWNVVTHSPASDYEVGVERWFNGAFVPMVITGSLLPFVVSFSGDTTRMALSGRNSRRFASGLVGIGTVVSVRRTGTTLNDQPLVHIELDVVGSGGEQFRSWAKAYLPHSELAQLRPGIGVQVRYLPGQTDRVELDLSGDQFGARAAMDQLMLARGLTTPDALAITRNGVAAQGVVRAVTVPGKIQDGRPLVELDVVVTRPDGSTFEGRKERYVHPGAIQGLQVGSVVGVHYLPHDESQWTIAVEIPN